MFSELLKAFVMIFIAEMGDKTQILAMAFSTKYKVEKVLLGVFIGSLLNHALAILLGSNLHRILPINTLSIIAGFSFIFFALWNLRFDDEEEEVSTKSKGAVYTVAMAFFIGELGDKTQLTAIALSADGNYPLFILMGTVLGMVLTSFIGIWIGKKIGNRIDEFYIKLAATFVFLFFGYVKLFSSLPSIYTQLWIIIVFSLSIVLMSGLLLRPTLKQRRAGYITRYQQTARKLHEYSHRLKTNIEDICLGPEYCGDCDQEKCPIGQSKILVKDIESKKKYVDIVKHSNTEKPFKKEEVERSYIELIQFLEGHWNESLFRSSHEIRKNLELILFGTYIHKKTYKRYLKVLKSLDISLFEMLFVKA